MIDVIIKGRKTGKTRQGIEWLRGVRHGLMICPTPAMAQYMRGEYRGGNIRFIAQKQCTMLRGNSFDRVYIDECFALNNPIEYLRRELFPMLHMHVGNGELIEDRILMIGTPMGPYPDWLKENEGSLFNVCISSS